MCYGHKVKCNVKESRETFVYISGFLSLNPADIPDFSFSTELSLKQLVREIFIFGNNKPP